MRHRQHTWQGERVSVWCGFTTSVVDGFPYQQAVICSCCGATGHPITSFKPLRKG